jgi:hypothetical protein
MARFARVVALDTPHHVTQRGNAQRYILETDSDRLSIWTFCDGIADCIAFRWSAIA